MASPTPKSRPRPRNPTGRPHQQSNPTNGSPPEVVDPVWLLKAFGITVVVALVCGYLTACLLFYQGQWQFVLHPSRSTPAPSVISSASFQTVHFGVDESASPQLTGWFISAVPAARYAAYTVLYLPGGDGSLANAVATLSALHETGINVFAFDYRGYGQSAARRPNQKRMAEDAASAWQYLTISRNVPPSRIVLFGRGVGCALAAQLAGSHAEVPAVIFEAPRPDLIQAVLADTRTKSLPVRALFDQEFAVTEPASTLRTPKLFLLPPASNDPSATAAEIGHLTSAAAAPKMVVDLPSAEFNGEAYREQIIRFLDEYLH